MDGIADKCAITKRGARKVVRQLEADGWLTVKVSGGRGNKSIYGINMGGQAALKEEPPFPVSSPPKRGTAVPPSDIKGEQRGHKRGTAVPPNRPNRHIREDPPIVPHAQLVPFDPKPKPKRKTSLPEDATITDAMRAAASKRGHSQQEAEAQFEKFKNSALAHGRKYMDWNRAFITWLDSPYFKPITERDARNGNAETGAERAQRIARMVEAARNG